METQKQKAADAGDIPIDSPESRKPQDHVDSKEPINQRICFNLIRHRGAHSETKALNLFKSFAMTLKKADPSLIIHPFQASQQHFSSLATLKQIQIMENQKIHQFFKSYHQKQTYSLSGYFLITSALSFDTLFQIPSVSKWLHSYQYYTRICPSQVEEMVKIGALCYSSTFIFRDHLKQAIMAHQLWPQAESDQPTLLFDLFISEFISPGKRTKMLFVSTEKSKQEKVSHIFKQIYNGASKTYPMGYMMLYIPIQDIVTSTPEFRKNIVFNHEKFIGEEGLFSIGGLNDLNTVFLLKNKKKVAIRTLLQSIPAS